MNGFGKTYFNNNFKKRNAVLKLVNAKKSTFFNLFLFQILKIKVTFCKLCQFL